MTRCKDFGRKETKYVGVNKSQMKNWMEFGKDMKTVEKQKE